jgi:glycosyltransferase involved in cell wall biosynthesis
VTALAVSAQLGGTERVLLDFAARAFEWDIALRVLTPRSGPLIGILNELGIPAQVVEAPRALLRGSQRPGALATLPGALLALRGWSRQLAAHPFMRDAEVVYSVSFKTHAATVTGGPAARRTGGPAALVWHLHEFPPTGTGAIWRPLARRVPDRVIVNSRAVADAWFGPPDRRSAVSIIPNGVDLDRFHPRPRTWWIHDQLGIPREDRLIGMPAVFTRWKGQLEAVDAFARVANQFPEAHLLLVGGNIHDTAAEERYQRELIQAVARRRAEGLDRVHLFPFQPKIELVYPELDAALQYSIRPEAFGRVVLEAMACGVPVMAAAEGGAREILTEGGWLIAPRDPATLAAAMVSALQLSPDAREQIGLQGRARAEDHYSARRFAKEVADVIRKAT